MCVCVCVCVLVRETERKKERERESEREMKVFVSVCLCVCVCVCVCERERERDRQTEKDRIKSKWVVSKSVKFANSECLCFEMPEIGFVMSKKKLTKGCLTIMTLSFQIKRHFFVFLKLPHGKTLF